jgi:hypothetical protein
MPEAVYILCAATCVACAVFLFRGYFRSRARFLLWGGLCFAGLALNNVLLFVDLVVYREVDLRLWRTGAALAAMVLLLVGLIWDAE